MSYTDKTINVRQGFYFDGNVNYGLLSTSSTGFYYSTINRARLDINSSYMFGQVGMGGGYQRLLNGWLQKISVGAGFYYTPVTRISGNVVSNLDNASQTTRAFTISNNSEEVMLESRVNFLRFAKYFTTYVNAAVGMVFYNTQYERTSSSGVQLEQSHSNSDMLYKVGAGVEYDLDENMSLSLGYEYNSPTTIAVQEISNPSETLVTSPNITLNNNSIAFKLRYLI